MLDQDQMDEQGRLHLLVEPSPFACGECGRPGPNKRWRLAGNSGVLCTRCLSALVEETNQSLGAEPGVPAERYQPQPGDLYLHQLRPGQWNLHRYLDRTWEYQTMLTQAEAEKYVALMRLVGETNDVGGKRRYYRPLQA